MPKEPNKIKEKIVCSYDLEFDLEIFKEKTGDGKFVYVASCVDYNFVVQAKRKSDLNKKFANVVLGNIVLGLETFKRKKE